VNDEAMPPGPLAGVRVLDLSTWSPVRFGTTVLADLGADVVQIDRPAGAFREDIPLLTSTEHPRWLWHSRNKRSLGLDLRKSGAREVLLRLVEDADVVIEGFAVGVAAKLGLDYASLTKVKPDLIYASVTGFGQTGPNAAIFGHEMNYQALSGVTAAMAAARGGTPAILPCIGGRARGRELASTSRSKTRCSHCSVTPLNTYGSKASSPKRSKN